MTAPPSPSRKERILDAAEQAFAEFGFDGASLRHIVLQARVNLATVYYYFQSKEGLMAAVLERRFGPLRQEHLDLLRQFAREAGGQPLPVEKILEALLLPPLRLAGMASSKRRAVMRLVGRIATEPNPQFQELVRKRRKDLRAHFLEALQASLPGLPQSDLRWRFECVWGALALILCNPTRLEKETAGVCDPSHTAVVLSQMIRFFAAGFRAPATVRPKI